MQDRTRKLEAAYEAWRQRVQLLAFEVEAAQRIQQVATQLIGPQGTRALYDQILYTAQSLVRADLASLQMVSTERRPTGELLLLAHRGLSAEAAQRWEWIAPSARTTCGEAFRTGRRIVVPDVRTCDFMAGSEDLKGFLDVGIRAAQSSPLISRSAGLVGMLTTCWREPHEMSARELRSLDVLTRLAADLIERSRLDEARKESEQRLALIYNTVRDVIFHVAVEPEGQFRYISVNTAFLRLTGLRREMVEAKTVNEVIPESSRTIVLSKYRRAIEEKTMVLWEQTCDYPAGRLTAEVSVVPVFDDKGACTHLVGSLRDITARRRAEAALRESEELLRRAERLAQMGHWYLDITTSHLHWSEGMFRILGHPEGYAPNLEESSRLIAPQDRDRAAQWARDCLAMKKGGSIELQVTQPDGEVRICSIISEIFLDEEGRPARLFGSCQDVTESRRAQEEASARQRLESLGTLASGIAHDFGNLFSAVLVRSELALSEFGPAKSPVGELKSIHDIAMRGSAIVHQLLVYAGKEHEVPVPVDVSQVVKEMVDLLKISVSRHATLQIELGQHLPTVRASAAQISQLVMNLLANASDALGDREGVIRLTTQRVVIEQGSQEIKGLAEREYVKLQISDTGCGMSPETQARVFDPFFSTKYQGHGLGLAVVHGIVKSLGGTIDLASELGCGTTFQILLPCWGNL